MAEQKQVAEGKEEEHCPPWGEVSILGSREKMEDAVAIEPMFQSSGNQFYHFFGVYDGHGGAQAALHCKRWLHQAVAEQIRSTDPKTEDQWKSVMAASFLKMNVEVPGMPFTKGKCFNLKARGIDTSDCVGGTTAVVAVIDYKRIVVANCGDSRAILCRGGKAIALSADHKPNLPHEQARIEAAGGKVIFTSGASRVMGILAMSRSIGDRYLEPYVIADPDLSFTKRTKEDEWLILASDGLWDKLSNDSVCDICRKSLQCSDLRRPGDLAAMLAEVAIKLGSKDNISVVVIDLRHT